MRAFGPVSPDSQEPDSNKDDLHMKRKQRANREAEQGLTWAYLARTFKSKAVQESADTVTDKLRQLTHIAREMGNFYN